MLKKRTVGALCVAASLMFVTGASLAEGRLSMDWAPVRDPATQALEQIKAGKNEEFKASVKNLVVIVDELNSQQQAMELDTAYDALVKIRDEQDLAVATKMLEDFIPTLKDW